MGQWHVQSVPFGYHLSAMLAQKARNFFHSLLEHDVLEDVPPNAAYHIGRYCEVT